MSVEMYRHITHCLSYCFHERLYFEWSQQTGHILNPYNMSSRGLDFCGKTSIVVDIVDLRVNDIACIAHTYFRYLPGGKHSIYRHHHTLNDIKAIEYAKYVHAILCRQLYELLYHIVRVGGIAHCIGSSDQHLQANVGTCFSNLT